jgi:hypothetical protein
MVDQSKAEMDFMSRAGGKKTVSKTSLVEQDLREDVLQAPITKVGPPGPARDPYCGSRGVLVSRKERAFLKEVQDGHGNMSVRMMRPRNVHLVYKFWFNVERRQRDSALARLKGSVRSGPYGQWTKPENRRPVVSEEEMERLLVAVGRRFPKMHSMSDPEIVAGLRKLATELPYGLLKSGMVTSSRRKNKQLNGNNGSVTNTDDHGSGDGDGKKRSANYYYNKRKRDKQSRGDKHIEETNNLTAYHQDIINMGLGDVVFLDVPYGGVAPGLPSNNPSTSSESKVPQKDDNPFSVLREEEEVEESKDDEANQEEKSECEHSVGSGPEAKRQRLEPTEFVDDSDPIDWLIEELTHPTTILLSDGYYLEYKGNSYVNTEYDLEKGRVLTGTSARVFVPVESGIELPEDVEVRIADRFAARGILSSSSSIVVDPLSPSVVAYAPSIRERIVMSAEDYTWFPWVRSLFVTSRKVLFKGKTLYKRVCSVHRKALDLLVREKIGSALSEQNNNLFQKLLFTNFRKVPPEILQNTVLYFVEKRVRAQVAVSATTKAALAFKADTGKYVPAETVGSKLSDIENIGDEGNYQFTNKREVALGLAEGKTVCVRKEYVSCDKSYIGKEIEYEMYESIEDREVCEERGCYLDEKGLHCDTDFMCATPYKTIGTHFVTKSEVINHKSIEQICASFNRILLPVDDVKQKRAFGTRMGERTMEYLEEMIFEGENSFDTRGALNKLTRLIRRSDPEYDYGELAKIQFENQHGKVVLSEEDENYCYVRALMKFARSHAEMSYAASREKDEIADIERYTEEIGTKIKERKRFISECVNGSDKSKKFLAVQMKPHETQKYKQGKLKFGRLVISIVGQGWIDARPSLLCDAKHVLEEEVDVVIAENGKIRVCHAGYQVAGELPHPQIAKKSWYKHRSVISDTTNETLAETVERYDTLISLAGVRATFCLSHGDDMLMVSNRHSHDFTDHKWYEMDIADNDSSHMDIDMRLEYLTLGARNSDVTEVFRQLAMPILFVNPANEREYIKLRYKHGMRMISGSVATTYLNSCKSMDLMLSTHMLDNSTDQACLRQGFRVTEKIGELEDVSFLSRYFSRSTGTYKAYRDAACWLRNFGKAEGDFKTAGKDVSEKAVNHCKAVVQEMAAQSNLTLRHELERKFKLKRFIFLRTGKNGLTDEDNALIRYYYGKGGQEQGTEEYKRLLQQVRSAQTYGTAIKSVFVDKSMEVKYGMSASCT